MSGLFTKFLEEEIPYRGSELAPHWIAKRTGVFASSIVAFRGLCQVATGEMVDLEDRLQEEKIVAKEMLHFLGEWFDLDLNLAIARQRLFIAGFMEILGASLEAEKAHSLYRIGNDLFLRGKASDRPSKLSVSIVTSSPVSTLFHFGVNINASGAPVQAVGLEELGIDVNAIAQESLKLFSYEWESMAKARCKVAPRW